MNQFSNARLGNSNQNKKKWSNSLIAQGLIWHFSDTPKGVLRAFRNFLLFNLNYFSVPTLLKTFFSPWRRYSYRYGKIFEIKKNFGVFVFNSMSRIIGAILRAFFIIVGLFLEILIFLGGVIIFLGWLFLPFFLIFGLFFGIKLLL